MTIVCNPHKVHGSESNDLVLQLPKARIASTLLATSDAAEPVAAAALAMTVRV